LANQRPDDALSANHRSDRLSSGFDDDPAEEQAARFAQRADADVQYECVQLAQGRQLNGAAAHHRCVVPDVVEGKAGKLAAPAERHRYAAEHGEDFVAAAERAVETFVAVSPHAVDRTDAIGLAENFLELYLNM